MALSVIAPSTSIFDAEQNSANHSSLNRISLSHQNGPEAGGRFAPPPEFDRNRFAAAWAAEGHGVQMMQGRQLITGTPFQSDGWEVWTFPEDSNIPDGDKKKEVKNPNWTEGSKKPKTISVPVLKKHPLAGKPHSLPPLDRDGVVYVLMYRPIEVQEQVNEVLGLLSIEQMTAEVNGQTIAGLPSNDPGMLGAERLKKAYHEQDIDIDREAEQSLGRSAVVHTSLPGSQAMTLRGLAQKLSR